MTLLEVVECICLYEIHSWTIHVSINMYSTMVFWANPPGRPHTKSQHPDLPPQMTQSIVDIKTTTLHLSQNGFYHLPWMAQLQINGPDYHTFIIS
jgi:hypothetical protein